MGLEQVETASLPGDDAQSPPFAFDLDRLSRFQDTVENPV
jgi:hypothetical protein